MAPPRYSPLALIASNVVAVPMSTTMHGPAVEVVGAHGVGDAVGARPPWGCRRGSASRSWCPGPSTTQGTSANQRVAIWRSSAVTCGTDELTAMPVTEAAMSRPSRSRSWVSSTACSSGVRVGTVESRQWWVRPRGAVGSCSVPMPTPTPSSITGTVVGVVARVEADDGLGVADVDDQEHGSAPSSRAVCCSRPPASVQTRSSPRSSTGAEWVSAPTEIRSGPGGGVGADGWPGSHHRRPR